MTERSRGGWRSVGWVRRGEYMEEGMEVVDVLLKQKTEYEI